MQVKKLTRVFTWGSNSHGQLGLAGVALEAQVPLQ
jgi:alpha-tubulin suppressor-like RCC1 family protein